MSQSPRPLPKQDVIPSPVTENQQEMTPVPVQLAEAVEPLLPAQSTATQHPATVGAPTQPILPSPEGAPPVVPTPPPYVNKTWCSAMAKWKKDGKVVENTISAKTAACRS